MKVKQLFWDDKTKSFEKLPQTNEADLIIYFGDREYLQTPCNILHSEFPDAEIIGCSSGGHIVGHELCEQTFSAVAIKFKNTQLKTTSVHVANCDNSYESGKKIGNYLKSDDLKAILFFSDGININGCALSCGLADAVEENIPVIGGMAGDNDRFYQTSVGLNNTPQPNTVAAVGFYGNSIQLGYGSGGGWRPYGPTRQITRSCNNILYEVDNKPALDLYEKYLGEEAEALPASALLFPLSINRSDAPDDYVLRTILSINYEDRSLVFAGNVPEGSTARFMRSSFNDLIDGAADASRIAVSKNSDAQFALLISCIGRRLLLGQQAEDELEAVAKHLPPTVPSFGFYSYGEICPGIHSPRPRLHNETMTITLMSEN